MAKGFVCTVRKKEQNKLRDNLEAWRLTTRIRKILRLGFKATCFWVWKI